MNSASPSLPHFPGAPPLGGAVTNSVLSNMDTSAPKSPKVTPRKKIDPGLVTDETWKYLLQCRQELLGMFTKVCQMEQSIGAAPGVLAVKNLLRNAVDDLENAAQAKREEARRMHLAKVEWKICATHDAMSRLVESYQAECQNTSVGAEGTNGTETLQSWMALFDHSGKSLLGLAGGLNAVREFLADLIGLLDAARDDGGLWMKEKYPALGGIKDDLKKMLQISTQILKHEAQGRPMPKIPDLWKKLRSMLAENVEKLRDQQHDFSDNDFFAVLKFRLNNLHAPLSGLIQVVAPDFLSVPPASALVRRKGGESAPRSGLKRSRASGGARLREKPVPPPLVQDDRRIAQCLHAFKQIDADVEHTRSALPFIGPAWVAKARNRCRAEKDGTLSPKASRLRDLLELGYSVASWRNTLTLVLQGLHEPGIGASVLTAPPPTPFPTPSPILASLACAVGQLGEAERCIAKDMPAAHAWLGKAADSMAAAVDILQTWSDSIQLLELPPKPDVFQILVPPYKSGELPDQQTPLDRRGMIWAKRMMLFRAVGNQLAAQQENFATLLQASAKICRSQVSVPVGLKTSRLARKIRSPRAGKKQNAKGEISVPISLPADGGAQRKIKQQTLGWLIWMKDNSKLEALQQRMRKAAALFPGSGDVGKHFKDCEFMLKGCQIFLEKISPAQDMNTAIPKVLNTLNSSLTKALVELKAVTALDAVQDKPWVMADIQNIQLETEILLTSVRDMAASWNSVHESPDRKPASVPMGSLPASPSAPVLRTRSRRSSEPAAVTKQVLTETHHPTGAGVRVFEDVVQHSQQAAELDPVPRRDLDFYFRSMQETWNKMGLVTTQLLPGKPFIDKALAAANSIARHDPEHGSQGSSTDT